MTRMSRCLLPTLTAEQAQSSLWNVVIVGAGPAGALAALLLSRRGRRVLLADKSSFPRDKVCGCCLNAVAAEVLRRCCLEEILNQASPLRQLLIRNRRHELASHLPDSYVLSRDELDTALVQHAIAAGAHFLPRCTARLRQTPEGETVPVELQCREDTFTLRAQLVLACDGIRGHLVDATPSCAWQVARDAWIGVAATLEGDRPSVPPGQLAMHVGPAGYVGVVQLQDGRPHLAAAVCPVQAKRHGGPANLVRAILRSCGVVDCPPLHDAGLMGTPLLTRRRRVLGTHRVLTSGDACGYVEPFTGEGIAWALQSAEAIAVSLPPSLDEWPADLPRTWTRRHATIVGRHQRACRALRYLLHRPQAASAALAAACAVPAIVRGFVRFLNRPAGTPHPSHASPSHAS